MVRQNVIIINLINFITMIKHMYAYLLHVQILEHIQIIIKVIPMHTYVWTYKLAENISIINNSQEQLSPLLIIKYLIKLKYTWQFNALPIEWARIENLFHSKPIANKTIFIQLCILLSAWENQAYVCTKIHVLKICKVCKYVDIKLFWYLIKLKSKGDKFYAHISSIF